MAFYFPKNPTDGQITTTPLGQNFMFSTADAGWRCVSVSHYSNNPLTVSLFVLGYPINLPLGGANGVAPYRFAITSGILPAGIVLSDDGVLTGAATGAGPYSFTVLVTDFMGGTGSVTFTGIISD